MTDATPYMPDTPDRLTFGAQPHPEGHFCLWEQHVHALARARAAVGTDWRTDLPEVGRPVIAEINIDQYRTFRLEPNGTWSLMAGDTVGKPNRQRPRRWIYYPGTAPADPPPSTPTTVPKSLQYGIDSLKLRYTTAQILDALDRSPFDEPETGAPEE
jgi:hypothetical protein